MIMLLLASEALSAATLLGYEQRVVLAAEQIKRIKKDPAYSDDGIASIKELLPESEQIRIEGRVVTVDNSWLHSLLNSYKASRDAGQRLAYLDEAESRLRALDRQLLQPQNNSQNATAAGDPHEKIREILSRSTFQPKTESPIAAFIKKMWDRVMDFLKQILDAFMRLLASLFGASSGGNWFAIAVIVAALVAALIGVLRITRNRRLSGKRAAKRTVLGEEIEAGMTARELAESAIEAARRGDFRRAMRGLYIALLYEMAERDLVELDESATNHEYLARVSRFSALTAPMRYLTERFDYFWYGMFPSSEQDYTAYLARYKEAVEQVERLGREPVRA